MYPKNKPLPPEAAGRAAEFSNRNVSQTSVESNSAAWAMAAPEALPTPVPAAPCVDGTGGACARQVPITEPPPPPSRAPLNQAVPPTFMGAQSLSPVGNGSFPASNSSFASNLPHGPPLMSHSMKTVFPPAARPPPPYATASPSSSGVLDERMLDSFGGIRPSHPVPWARMGHTPPPLPPFLSELPPYPVAAPAVVPPPPCWPCGAEAVPVPNQTVNRGPAFRSSQTRRNGEVCPHETEVPKNKFDACGGGDELLMQQYRSDVRFLTRLVVTLLERMHTGSSGAAREKLEDGQQDADDASLAEDSCTSEVGTPTLKRQLNELEGAITALQVGEDVVMSPHAQQLFDRVLAIPQLTALASRVGGAQGGESLVPHRSVSSFGGSEDFLSLRVSSEVKAYMRAVDFETTRPLMLNVVVATDSAASSRTPSRTTSLQGVSAPSVKEETTTPL